MLGARIKCGARPRGRERVARALTREESRERIQPDVWPLPGGKDPDKRVRRISAVSGFRPVKYLLTTYLAVGRACKIAAEMAIDAVIACSPGMGSAL